jgi:hypothetical protein
MPIQAEKLRPDRKAVGSARLVGSVPSHDQTIKLRDMNLQRPQLGAETGVSVKGTVGTRELLVK